MLHGECIRHGDAVQGVWYWLGLLCYGTLSFTIQSFLTTEYMSNQASTEAFIWHLKWQLKECALS